MFRLLKDTIFDSSLGCVTDKNNESGVGLTRRLGVQSIS